MAGSFKDSMAAGYSQTGPAIVRPGARPAAAGARDNAVGTTVLRGVMGTLFGGRRR